MREQVERLEDDPDPAPDRDPRRRPAIGDVLAVEEDPAGVDRLEQVDAAQQRRLAGARRADQADDLVRGDFQVDPAQDRDLVERLVEALDADGRRPAPVIGRWPRCAAGPGR